jgi:hypothetical protein
MSRLPRVELSGSMDLPGHDAARLDQLEQSPRWTLGEESFETAEPHPDPLSDG